MRGMTNKRARLENHLASAGLGPHAIAEFMRLVEKYESGPARIGDWSAVQAPSIGELPVHEDLEEPDARTAGEELRRLVVVKLNGGLGTTMGCPQPKSTLPVRVGKSFLDLIVEQIVELNHGAEAAVPLLLMNSFHTDRMTADVLGEYTSRLPISTFNQNRFPRLLEETLEPLSASAYGDAAWYPPGHGDFYACLDKQGILDELLASGREVAFISNADNLGATVDRRILHHMLARDIPFIMEMTPKTAADVKGGTLYRHGGRLKLLELAHVPEAHVDEFCGQEKFRVFNTNNIWVHLGHLKRVLGLGPLGLDIIVNRKEVDGKSVLQLETAVGSALERFDGAIGLAVGRERFLPVNKTEDLLLIRSDLFVERGGRLARNPARRQTCRPVVKLDERFGKMADFDSRVPMPLSLVDLEQLEIKGDVRFEGAATLKGRVSIVAGEGQTVVPDGALIDNRRFTG